MATEVSQKENIISSWILWQYFEMPKFLWQVWNNYFMFASNYFSLGLLLKTFFSPWKRYKWRYPRAFDLGEFFNTLISNTFSRIIGAMMRTVLIIAGIFFQVFVAAAGFIVFISWLVVPFIIVGGFLFFFAY